MPSPNIQYRAVPPLDAALSSRTRGDAPPARDLSETARRDATRYYALMAAELATVRLSPGEASLMCDLLNGTLIDDQLLPVRHLHHEAEDGLADGLAEKWEVDGPALVKTVANWTPGQRLAVVDAAERFWRSAPHVDIRAGLRQVGLLPSEPNGHR